MMLDDRTTPDYLERFVPRPAPANLRRKVLAAAAATRPAGSFLTSVQWGMTSVCALLIVGALAGDAILSMRQARRLDALLNDRPAVSPIGDADRSALEELVGVDQARTMRFQMTRPHLDRGSRMEGWLDGNALAFEEKEDVDVHSKNPW